MADDVPSLLQSATAAVTAARRELAEIERTRESAFADQLEVATSLSRSKQLTSAQSAVAADALKFQREQQATMKTAIEERRGLFDKVNDDIAGLIGTLSADPA